MPYCLTCGSGIDEYDSGYYARNMLCIPCYSRKASEVPQVSCGRCGVRIGKLEARERKGGYYCNYCASELERLDRLPVCAICKQKIEASQAVRKASDGRVAHSSCADGQGKAAMRSIMVEGGPRSAAKPILSSLIVRIGCMLA